MAVASARETIGRVAAGAIAKKILKLAGGIEVRAYITRVHDIEMPALNHFPSLEEVEASPVRCPTQNPPKKWSNGLRRCARKATP